MGRYTTEAHKSYQSLGPVRPLYTQIRTSPLPRRGSLTVYGAGSVKEGATSAAFSLRSASPRSFPVLRTARFQPVTEDQGSPSRRASPLPIASRRAFQST